MDKRRVYTDEHIQFLKNNAEGRPIRELTDLFNKQFNTQKSPPQIKTLLGRKGISNGIAPGFKPGQGGKHSPIGAELTTVDGYIIVKTSNCGKAWEQWRKKHTLIWEAANGQTPDGHVVIFGDGNKRNFNLENLILVSRQELAVLNAFSLHGATTDLTRAGVALADLHMKIAERMGRSRSQKRKRYGGDTNA